MAGVAAATSLKPTLLPGETLHDVVESVINLLPSASVRGTLHVTDYRAVFIPSTSSSAAAFDLPLAAIDEIARREWTLTMACKDMRTIRLDMCDAQLKNEQSFRALHLLIMRMRPPMTIVALFAFDYFEGSRQAHSLSALTNGWTVYSPLSDYTRLGFVAAKDPSSSFRLLKNAKFRFLPTYPQLMVIPSQLTEEQLVRAARIRKHARLPVAVWRHPEHNCVLVRSSEPDFGLFQKRDESDESLLQCYRDAANANGDREHPLPLYIFHVHSPSLLRITDTAVKPAGNCDNAVLRTIHIKSYKAVRKSFEGLKALIGNTKDGDRRYLSRLESTGWLESIVDILSGACDITRVLNDTGASVLVHGSDGRDRTAQLSSLIQLLSDPEYRTIRGFAIVIEKEWCSFGHQFADRICVGKNPSEDLNERSPVMLQFLDCVWQVMQQFPTSFEFNERLLVHVSNALISGLYGTFLFNTERERVEEKIYERTESVWTPVLKEPESFLNPSYRRTTDVLYPRVNPKQIGLWESMYYRWDPNNRPDHYDGDLCNSFGVSLLKTSSPSSKFGDEVHGD